MIDKTENGDIHDRYLSTETEQATSGSPVITRTEYDALGRVWKQSLPSDNGVYQYVTFEYDALGRKTKATNADGSAVRTCYVGDLAISRDEAGKWRQSKSDALGRLVEVTEDPASVTCDSQTNSSSGLSYVTKYAYNALDNLLTVSHMVGGSAAQTRSFTYDGLGRLLTANNPESGTISYLYDNNGNVTQKTDARGVVTSYAYDKLNRPLSKTYSDPNTSSVAWIWDSAKLGKLTSVESGISKTTFTYDDAARIASSVQRTDGVDYDFHYRYHKGWGLKQVQYPSDRWIRFTPDVADRLVTVERLNSAETVDKTYWQGVQYAPQGVPKRITLGSSPVLYHHAQFNARQQVTNIKVGTGGTYTDAAASDRLGITFTYGANNNGNILTQLTQVPGGNFAQTYNYDPLNRLCTVREAQTTSPWGPHTCGDMQGLFGGESWRQTFGYDRFGNQWAAQHLGANMPYSGLRPTQQSNIDPVNNRLTEVANQIAFDAAGQQVRHGGWTLAYDAEGRMKTAMPSSGAAAACEYDGDGRRVKKTVGGVSTWFVYGAMGELAAEYLTTPPSGAAATHFVTTDHLGSTRLVTDGSGNVVSRHDYLPFGEEINAGIGGRTAAMKYVVNTALTQRFTGKEHDTETGLDYFGARYLSGVLGRFSSPDPSSKGVALGDPQSWNLYGYTRNRPLTNIDVNGNWSQPVHHDLVRFSLSGLLSAGEIEHLVQRQVAMDKDQSAGGSFKHAMGQPGEASGATLQRMWAFVAGNMRIANADSARNGNLTNTGLTALGDAIHTVQDFTSPMHVSDAGVPIVWRGLLSELTHLPAHFAGENSASDDWSRFGQAIRLTLAAFVQASPGQAKRAGLSAANLDRIANQRISRYVEHYFNSFTPLFSRTHGGGYSEGERDAARQCALGNPAACR